MHGKVERKIQDIKRSLKKNVNKNRLSVLQWETLGQQISNNINNVPIGLGKKAEMLENVDILSPNKLILDRNNTRSPTAPLQISHDVRKIIESNNETFKAWFREWLISYVPTLIEKPNIYAYLHTNNLITKNQSGFRPGDSTTNQLLYLLDKIHQVFDSTKSLEVRAVFLDISRAVFLDISRAFDKVWRDGLIFKLEQNGISGNLPNIFKII